MTSNSLVSVEDKMPLPWLTPVGDLKPRDGIVFNDLGGSPYGAGVTHAPNHQSDANVRHDDGVTLGLCEENRVGCTYA